MSCSKQDFNANSSITQFDKLSGVKGFDAWTERHPEYALKNLRQIAENSNSYVIVSVFEPQSENYNSIVVWNDEVTHFQFNSSEKNKRIRCVSDTQNLDVRSFKLSELFKNPSRPIGYHPVYKIVEVKYNASKIEIMSFDLPDQEMSEIVTQVEGALSLAMLQGCSEFVVESFDRNSKRRAD